MEIKKELSILIVEDDLEDLFFTRRALDRSGAFHLRIEHASSLSDALNKLDFYPFGVVLVDLFLPDSSGIESFKIIREKVPEIPVIILTGANDDGLVKSRFSTIFVTVTY